MTSGAQQSMRMQQAEQIYAAGRRNEAATLCAQMLKDDPRHVRARDLLGQIAYESARFEEALEAFETCSKLEPESARHHTRAAQMMISLWRYEDALARLERSRELNPDDPVAATATADALEKLVRDDDAIAFIESYVERHEPPADMLPIYARLLMRKGCDEQAASLVTGQLARGDLPDDTRQELCFVAGKVYEKLGRYGDAFSAYHAGNQLLKVPFDLDRRRNLIDQQMRVFESGEPASVQPRDDRGSRQVFVTGIPRSGTTLVVQIIDAHPAGFSIGEQPLLQRIIDSMQNEIASTDPYPLCLADLDQDDANAFAAQYACQIDAPDSAARIVEQNLMAHLHLGLVSILFPGARIIHCVRDPMDTCFSCFANRFRRGSHVYTTDLAMLGRVYRLHERIMDFWKRTLSLNMLVVPYEAVVQDLDTWAKTIIDFCGLPWDERCLRYYESDRVVTSLSYEQVRRPTYTSSIGRAERFGSLLEPLHVALNSPDGTGLSTP